MKYKKRPYTWYYIENELKHYHELKRQLKELTEDIIYQGGASDGQPRGNTTSDPTSQKAIKMMSSLAILELTRRVKAMSSMYENLNEEQRRFFELHFTKNKSIIYVSNEIGLTERTGRNWREYIIRTTMRNYGFDFEFRI